jgi:predicted TPR repeat methyltransferase
MMYIGCTDRPAVRFLQAYDAAWAAIGHAPDNSKAWVRFGEACRAAGRWQLAQLAYSTAMEELGLQDPAVTVSVCLW